MFDLTKAEYEVLFYFYDSSKSLTKQELLESVLSLNKNTTAAVIRSLLDKGYLEIADIRYSTTVLARAYKPCVSILEFLKNEYGELSVEKVVGHLISTMEDTQVLNQLLALISEKKYSIQKGS
ncbi:MULTISPECIES: MarR family transcriptional regulator [Enterococcus]|uniref:MarR family transcriptional regulator n=1 Tax=Enterococcus TaxID=1350 RepID=UPI00203268DC|nr:MarR family transcriptional regulator [Enterococcus faecalis]HAQ9443456.1 BlaI/MecI/CopY family transcriptional regulator [Enterococcus faecium]WCG31831.1 MarR family transcriptional regulator [Enterococcus faecalis]HAP4509409.1 BlaI/MecI/CopY family transcriptional regulator [Enterococcus faecalis]HAP4512413.1 BlaI/MecI/CopY family transcriptional regulator [Enterococcus faecalis]HAP4525650.1 BlaI/MecI/CopY family transcriptional regulator [Enterococcus faecalis]